MTALLTVRDLTIHLGHTVPVRGVDFTLEPGRILGLTGESGSGKSLTAFATMGLLPQGAKLYGEMMFDGKVHDPLDENSMAQCRAKQIGIIFQEPMTALNPLMTIGNQVAELFRHHQRLSRKLAAQKARLLLNRVGLEEIPQKRYPHQISGGQRQRVAIAMAIALRPKLLLADEPTTALDTTTGQDILNLLVRLVKEDGMGMILITHDLALMARYADDLLVMNRGEVATQGSISMMLQPQHTLLKELISASKLPTREASHSMGKPILHLEQVAKSYHRKKPFITDANFTLKRGTMTGLVGRSGCGKSTLARIALALTHADGGRVIFDRTTITPSRILKTTRLKLSAVFQDPYGSFNPRMTVAELIAEPLWQERSFFHRSSIQGKVKNALEAVRIPQSYLERYISQCSGGERQRIAFARAMITKPEVIILDEPVSALDAPHRKHVMAEMARLSCEFHIATLLISHDLSVVRAFCPYLMVMAEGQIVEGGATDDIFESPKHPETYRLINAMPDLTQALAELKTREEVFS